MKQRIWIFIFGIILCVIFDRMYQKDEQGKNRRLYMLSVEEV